MKTQLQLALDVREIDMALRLMDATTPWVDDFEVGSLLLVSHGVSAIRAVRARSDDHPVIVDAKVADAGALIAEACFDAGADAITVLAQSSQDTVEGIRRVADRYQGRVWLDLIGSSNPVMRAQVMAPLVDGFVIYRPPAGIPRVVVNNILTVDKSVRVAGGLTVEDVGRLKGLALDGIIVGSAILRADDPGRAAWEFHEALKEMVV